MVPKAIILTFLATIGAAHLQAQVSLRCYTAPKNSNSWFIGVRTGVSREYHNSFYAGNEDQRLLGWSQQIYLKRVLNERFQLEFQVMHQNSVHDRTGITGYPGLSQIKATSRNERLHSNLLLHYFFTEINAVRISIAAGIGLITSREHYEESYAQNGKQVRHSFTNYPVKGPNMLIAITYSYALNKQWAISTQLGYSNMSVNPGLSHINWNAGLEYRLY